MSTMQAKVVAVAVLLLQHDQWIAMHKIDQQYINVLVHSCLNDSYTINFKFV